MKITREVFSFFSCESYGISFEHTSLRIPYYIILFCTSVTMQTNPGEPGREIILPGSLYFLRGPPR